MINIKIPTKRKPKVNWSTQFSQQRRQHLQQYYPPVVTSNTSKTIFDEALRRDRIIRDMVAELPYKEGDVCMPASPESIPVYGNTVRIERICTTYGMFGKDEKWPSNDVPMIVTAYAVETDKRFHCTPRWLVKKVVES